MLKPWCYISYLILLCMHIFPFFSLYNDHFPSSHAFDRSHLNSYSPSLFHLSFVNQNQPPMRAHELHLHLFLFLFSNNDVNSYVGHGPKSALFAICVWWIRLYLYGCGSIALALLLSILTSMSPVYHSWMIWKLMCHDVCDFSVWWKIDFKTKILESLG